MIRIADLISHWTYRGELPPPNPPGYQFITAGNGVLLRASNPYVDVAQVVAPGVVRGLPVLRPFLTLRGALPGRFLLRIILHAQRYLEQEVVYQVAEVDGRFKLRVVAYGSKASATFEDCAPADAILFEAHSHNTMGAFFSGTDNAFEQHFRFYAVVGNLDRPKPAVAFRLGVYGYHFPLRLSQLFDFSEQEQDCFEEVQPHANGYRNALPR
jgi:PRTRC genetic system protein A